MSLFPFLKPHQVTVADSNHYTVKIAFSSMPIWGRLTWLAVPIWSTSCPRILPDWLMIKTHTEAEKCRHFYHPIRWTKEFWIWWWAWSWKNTSPNTELLIWWFIQLKRSPLGALELSRIYACLFYRCEIFRIVITFATVVAWVASPLCSVSGTGVNVNIKQMNCGSSESCYFAKTQINLKPLSLLPQLFPFFISLTPPVPLTLHKGLASYVTPVVSGIYKRIIIWFKAICFTSGLTPCFNRSLHSNSRWIISKIEGNRNNCIK